MHRYVPLYLSNALVILYLTYPMSMMVPIHVLYTSINAIGLVHAT